ncbi:hypothetical protein D3C75_994160 [compost metagenome]
MQRQRQGTGIRPKPGRQHRQRGPHQFRDGPKGIQQQPRTGLQRPTEPASGRQRQQHAQQHGQQSAQARHGQGFQRPVRNRAQVPGRQVRVQETPGIFAHLPQPVVADQRLQVQLQVRERGHHRSHDGA